MQSTQPRGNSSRGESTLEPEIESLPWFGTSWYARGPSYWFRRVVMTLLCLGVVGLYAGIIGGVLLSGLNSQDGRVVSTVLLVLVVVVGFATGIWIWRRSPGGQSAQPSRRTIWGVAGTGAAAGTLVRAGWLLGGVLIFFGAILTSGLVVVLLIKSFTPVLEPEQQARERLEPWFREHGRTAPWQGA
jgi:hypothetical protein